ncbi:nucleotidyltransferase family protein [Variovorax sp. CAN2819]|uniref:nucleotidyltransferase family protein n=1 Tax=Variovorax sp. CAN15 TaxID=3046727 RepID=UPI002649CB42|nr:nucleotidyltransferase family protein [Variovorax sp. CAN15]MDN6882924.1 nucleotidyltransferase family protein [Variovorax sp. CAN15]
MALTPDALIAQAMQDPVNAALASRLPGLGLRQSFLTAGCIFQSAWNHTAGRPPGWGVKDYDVFYFDDSDLSWEAEDAVIRRVREATADLGATIEVKNQARVHLWYEQRFKAPYPRLQSARDGIDRYLIACTRVGIDLADGSLYAPDGLDDLAAGILRMNPLLPMPEMFAVKARDYQSRWPWLRIATCASSSTP